MRGRVDSLSSDRSKHGIFTSTFIPDLVYSLVTAQCQCAAGRFLPGAGTSHERGREPDQSASESEPVNVRYTRISDSF